LVCRPITPDFPDHFDPVKIGQVKIHANDMGVPAESLPERFCGGYREPDDAGAAL
jgi:hypothetical protein